MERTHYFNITLFVLFIISATTLAQTCRCRQYKAYINQDINAWVPIIRDLEHSYAKQPNISCLYDLSLAQYGYIGYLIGLKKMEEANIYIAKSEPYFIKLKSTEYYKAEGEALYGAWYAFKIGVNPSSVFIYGAPAMMHINKAIEINPTSEAGWIEKGNSEYHMPRIFGGSYSKAAEYFKKAVILMEQKPENLKCNWLYLNAMLWLAKSYEKAGMKQEAKATYAKMYKHEPTFIAAKRWMEKIK